MQPIKPKCGMYVPFLIAGRQACLNCGKPADAHKPKMTATDWLRKEGVLK